MKNILARGGIEFIAVLLGISGSLWMENSKKLNIENEKIYSTLSSLNQELIEMKSYSKTFSERLNRDYNICEDILNNWGQNDVDILMNKELEGRRGLILTIKAYRAFHPPISIFSSLKSDVSIGIIKNTDIKVKINEIYEIMLSHIQEGIENERSLYQSLNEYIILNYPYLISDTKDGNYRLDLLKFINDKKIMGFMLEKNQFRSFLMRLIGNYINNLEELNVMVQSELK